MPMWKRNERMFLCPNEIYRLTSRGLLYDVYYKEQDAGTATHSE